MKITNIKESGSNNTILWALKNGATIYGDDPLCSIINDELFYLVTFSDVTFFELFRLTQMYRDKLKVIEEKVAEVPARNVLAEAFPGSYAPDEKEPDKNIPMLEIAEHSIQMFLNLALQMNTDNDIITPGASRLFLPMISRRFDVQVPVSFYDFVTSFKDEKEASELFNSSYPSNLNSQIVESEFHNVRMRLELAFVKATSILKYDERYDTYLKMTKYAPLKKGITNRLYKFNLLAFTKYDNISRGECRCNMFNADKNVTTKVMQHMARIKTPLKVEFIVQLPIQYMQIIENDFSPEEVGIIYESSMSNIIEGDIIYDDFITPDWNVESEDEEDQAKTKEYMNAISAYKQRITEANQTTLNSITILLNNGVDTDITSAFSMLPSIYTTKALLILNTEYADKYINIFDPLLADMFQEMMDFAAKIEDDIKKSIK